MTSRVPVGMVFASNGDSESEPQRLIQFYQGGLKSIKGTENTDPVTPYPMNHAHFLALRIAYRKPAETDKNRVPATNVNIRIVFQN